MSNYNGQLLKAEPLASYTTWRVGGVAKQLYKPSDLADLQIFLRTLPHDEPIIWIGLGSNCLIKDEGFSGTVILTQGCLKGIELLENNIVRVEAGISCASMARFCARQNLSGAEFWAGIPGTMGGALRMNAGCAGSETWEHVVEVETIDRAGNIQRKSPKDFQISYRSVLGLDENEWFTAAFCRFVPGNKEQALEKIKQLLEHRALTQPTNEYNCGSVFRNPPGNFAAKLIETCGLKGKQLGGAMVSTKHANFIITNGTALATDIESLISLVKSTVSEQTQIDLIPEVHIIGDQ